MEEKGPQNKNQNEQEHTTLGTTEMEASAKRKNILLINKSFSRHLVISDLSGDEVN